MPYPIVIYTQLYIWDWWWCTRPYKNEMRWQKDGKSNYKLLVYMPRIIQWEEDCGFQPGMYWNCNFLSHNSGIIWHLFVGSGNLMKQSGNYIWKISKCIICQKCYLNLVLCHHLKIIFAYLHASIISETKYEKLWRLFHTTQLCHTLTQFIPEVSWKSCRQSGFVISQHAIRIFLETKCNWNDWSTRLWAFKNIILFSSKPTLLGTWKIMSKELQNEMG